MKLKSKEQKAIYELFFNQNKSVKEIAEIKGTSKEAVYKTLRKIEYHTGADYRRKTQLIKKPYLKRNYCLFCKSIYKLNKHHVIPRQIKKDDTGKKLVILCSKCHKKLHKKFLNPLIKELKKNCGKNCGKNENNQQ